MKKSVILTILIIYVIAIFVVGLIGQKLKIYNPTVYVEKIECISEEYKEYDDSSTYKEKGYSGYINANYKEGLKVYIKCRVNPANATYKDLEYICESSICSIEKDNDGYATLTFTNSGSVDVIVKTTDGQNKTLKIKINAINVDDF